jgi:ribosome assembly protein SQT1
MAEEDMPEAEEDKNEPEMEILFEENPDGGEEEEDFVENCASEVFYEHKDSVYCCAFSKKTLSNGAIAFASGGGDEKGVLYHIFADKDPVKFQLLGHKDTVSCLAFSGDGTILATGGMDGLVLTWDTLTGKKLAELTGPTDSINWINFHPTLPACLAGDNTGMVWFWNAKTGKCAKVYVGHSMPTTCGSFRADGSEIWTASEDKTLRIWGPRTGATTHILNDITFHQAPITAGASSPTGILVATGDLTGIVKIARFDDVKILGQIDSGENSVEAVQFSPDTAWIGIASMGGTLSIWDANEFKMRHALLHPAGVTSFKWHPTRPFVVTGCADGAVRVWDIRSGKMLACLTGNKNVITDIDVRLVDGSKTDILIVTSSEDHTVRLFSFVEEGEEPSVKAK